MRAPLYALPPEDPKAFEELCWDLWRRLWNDPRTRMNAREGQPQAGVDVYGYPGRGTAIAGIQCKVRSQLKGSRLEFGEILEEVEKAKKFEPRLSKYLIATTSLRVGPVQEKVRGLDQQQRQAKSFRVEVLGWDDILLYLADHPDLIFKHLDYVRVDSSLFHSLPILRQISTDPHRKTALESLSGLSALQDTTTRTRIFEALRFSPSRAQLEISGLLDASVRRPGGLEALVEILDLFEDPEHLQPVLRSLDAFIYQPVHRAEAHRVNQILAQSPVPDSAAAACFRKVQPFAQVPGSKGRPLLPTLVDVLAQKPHRPPSEAPLLEFLEGFSRHITEAHLKAELQTWMENVAGRLGCDLASIQAQVASWAPESEEAVLLVKLTPDLCDPTNCRIEAWLSQTNAGDEMLRLPTPEESQPPQELRATLAEIFCYANRSKADRSALLSVELVLPSHLLHDCDMHGWEVPVGKKSREPLGGYCPVVARSYDRIYDPDLLSSWPLWREKWEQRPHQANGDDVFWLDAGQAFEGNLYATLGKAGSVVAAHASKPEPALENLETLLDAGIPVALWARHRAGASGEVEPALRELVCGGRLDRLPERLRTQRKKSAGEAVPAALWDHVTLLWDSPERLPPDVHYRLRAP